MTKKNTDEIFVDRNIEVSVPKPLVVQDKPKKKPKKEVSAERRAVLLEQLKKGRETAKKNRVEKNNKKTPTSETTGSVDIVDSVDKPEPKPQPKEKEPEIKTTWSIKDDINDLKYQLRELRNMMNKSKTEERVEAKIEKIIEKKEVIEDKHAKNAQSTVSILSTVSTLSTHNPKPPPSTPIPIPQKVVKSLFKIPMW